MKRTLLVALLGAAGLLFLRLERPAESQVQSLPVASNGCITLVADAGTAIGGVVLGRTGLTIQNDDLNSRSICFGFNAPSNAICPTTGGGGMTIAPGATAPIPLGYQTSGDGGYALVYVWSGAGTSDGGVCFAEVN